MKTYIPNVDIFENEKELILVADMPGVDKKDVELSVKENILSIKGKVDEKFQEFFPKSYERQFSLSEHIDQDKLSAKMENGSLILNLPKAQKSEVRAITIQ